MFDRLPVVVQIIATFCSRKSRGVVPQSTMPGGCAWYFAREIDPVAQRLDAAGRGEVRLGASWHWPAWRRPRWRAPGTANRESRWRGSARPSDPRRRRCAASAFVRTPHVPPSWPAAAPDPGPPPGTPPCSSTARWSSAGTARPRYDRRSRRSSGRPDRSCAARLCRHHFGKRVERHDQIIVDERERRRSTAAPPSAGRHSPSSRSAPW